MPASKDFAPILSDYAFFETQATEAPRDAAAYAERIAPRVAAGGMVRLLDFGCGTGSFTERLLKLVQIPPQRLELALVEPVRASHALAAERVASFSATAIEHADSLAQIGQREFDLIVANHVLYYVPDLSRTLADLHARLAVRGRLLTAIAGNDNPLIGFWRAGFALLGEPVPYHVAEDVAAGLAKLGIAAAETTVPYELEFADSEANRLTILRFLFAEHLPRMPQAKLLALFEPFARGGRIEIRTASRHFECGSGYS
jgi:trans-aconitate 2-methyltransferase